LQAYCSAYARAIASPLDEAAHLATAANEKGEALAIAEQTRRSTRIANGHAVVRGSPISARNKVESSSIALLIFCAVI
jgi:hypothetical protein